MPGINANLSQAAFDIWDRVPIKSRKSSGGVRGNPGRSAWLSSVIIEHAGWQERYAALGRHNSEELSKLHKLYIMRGTQLDTMRATKDKLQAIVLELTE
tara:strand:+ start:68 stop:364 length:297 start_codon:yes stop_codon:yes gene_type:complete